MSFIDVKTLISIAITVTITLSISFTINISTTNIINEQAQQINQTQEVLNETSHDLQVLSKFVEKNV